MLTALERSDVISISSSMQVLLTSHLPVFSQFLVSKLSTHNPLSLLTLAPPLRAIYFNDYS